MWLGVVVLCIAGTTAKDLPGTVCVEYTSPPIKTEQMCEVALKRVMKSEEYKAMTSLPYYDLELDGAECVRMPEKRPNKDEKLK